ncbi:hypothetical protein [Mycobacterium intracellulare]|uniref:hypothetical protein n=1 Tax=Mycobacterium intracellulare TaxID=1767 RepID=UPI0019159972|nr:hypothetical protein [Mycobacterium intracellulare]BCO71143.1 hypothetical protein MINTM008_04780 [Mycobacterium intracellulare]BCO76694.1 hypothetical protein MINTM009_04760 [Mycobacterium intracellulare]BCP40384.1 hypothetical protein MINTMi27_04770 [Mycobacterium intracellulare]
MKLFSDDERTDRGPARFSESDFQFLDRVAGPHWDRVRSLLEEWFSDHPEAAKNELHKRFTDKNNGQHAGAWWELYIASLFRHLGYELAPHPTIEGSERKPDFLVTRESSAFYVECTVTAAGGTPGTLAWIYDCISDVETRDFLVGIEDVKRGKQRPKRSDVTRPIAQWLAELDRDELIAAPEKRLPRKVIPIRDWSITCVAIPNRPDAGYQGGRLIAHLPTVSINYEKEISRIYEALSKKGRHYGREPLSLPLVVAVLENTRLVEADDIAQALFGREEWQLTPGDPDSIRKVRKRNGYWRGDWSSNEVQRGTRVSAALIGSGLRYQRIALDLPELWNNPWAAVPLGQHDGFATVSVETGEVVRTEGKLQAANVFGLDPDWPYFPVNRFG